LDFLQAGIGRDFLRRLVQRASGSTGSLINFTNAGKVRLRQVAMLVTVFKVSVIGVDLPCSCDARAPSFGLWIQPTAATRRRILWNR
jgi:hypothetical protein